VSILHGRTIIAIIDRTYKFTVTFHGWDGLPEDPEMVYVKLYNTSEQLIENTDITANRDSVGVYWYTKTWDVTSQGVWYLEFSGSIGTTNSNLRFLVQVKFI